MTHNSEVQSVIDTNLLAVLVSGASTLIVVAATYTLTKQREREADWRRFKLDYYREYVAALSGVTESSISAQGQRRYADAVNNLSLVAPPEVLRALYALQDEIQGGGERMHHNARLGALIRAIRRDVQPSKPNDDGITFRLFDIPRSTGVALPPA